MDDIICPHCRGKLIWQNDFNFEDFWYEGDGIVSVWLCSKCGATVTVEIPLETEEE